MAPSAPCARRSSMRTKCLVVTEGIGLAKLIHGLPPLSRGRVLLGKGREAELGLGAAVSCFLFLSNLLEYYLTFLRSLAIFSLHSLKLEGCTKRRGSGLGPEISLPKADLCESASRTVSMLTFLFIFICVH